MGRLWRIAFLVLSFGALFVAARAARLDRPWTGGHDQVGARYSLIARNFVREGILDPPLVQKAWSGRPPAAARDQYMTKHPPGVPLLLAAGFRLAGTDAPWVARLVMMLGALVSLMIVFRIVMRLTDARVAVATVFLMLAAPASIFYGAWVDPVSWWSIAFVLAAVDFWFGGTRPSPRVTLRRAPPPDGWTTAGAIAIAWSIAMLIEWNAVFLWPVFLADAAATGFRRRRRSLLLLAVATGAMAVTYRTILPTPGGIATRLAKLAQFDQWSTHFLTTVVGYLRDLVSAPLLAVVAIGVIAIAARAARRRVTTFDRVAFALLAFQLAYAFVYPFGNQVHDFCWLYAMPPLAMIAGHLLVRAHDRVRRATSPAVASVAFGLALAGWALWQAFTGLERLALPDMEARVNLAAARDLAEISASDEFVATSRAPERLMPIAFHADRPMVGGITTPAALRALADTPFAPAIIVFPKRDLATAGAFVAALDASAKRLPFDTFHAFDLRRVDLRTLAATGTTGARATERPAPGAPTAVVDGNRVEITWTPAPGERPTGYRVAFGTDPGIYPAMVTVPNPRIRWPTDARGTVRFVIRAIHADGSVSRPTAEHSFTLRGRRNPWANIAAIATALAAVSLAVWFVSRADRTGYA